MNNAQPNNNNNNNNNQQQPQRQQEIIAEEQVDDAKLERGCAKLTALGIDVQERKAKHSFKE